MFKNPIRTTMLQSTVVKTLLLTNETHDYDTRTMTHDNAEYTGDHQLTEFSRYTNDNDKKRTILHHSTRKIKNNF